MQLAKQLHKNIISKIVAIYGEQESNSIAFILMEYFDISKQDYVLNNKIQVNENELENIIQKLENNVPIQYALGEAWFYERKFIVDNNVLIPRPETEELCQLIIEDVRLKLPKPDTSNIEILDIGTGSGCIPITLKLEISACNVSALDISKEAIAIAKKNAEKQNAKIDFIQKDILNNNVDLSNYDIVVSNPPYVLNSEKKLMKQNVLDNEPHLALFVKDNDPLIFYNRIITLCVTNNVPQLYFEINEKYGEEVVDLMVKNGYTNVSIKKDMQGVDRIVYGILLIHSIL